MDKKTSTLIGIGIALILGGIYVISGLNIAFIFPDNKNNEEVTEPIFVEYTPIITLTDPDQLDSLILTKIVGKDWNIEYYLDLESSIRNSYENNLISRADKDILMNKLDLAYISTLKTATVAFFKTGKYRTDLKLLHSQILKFHKIAKYKEYVQDINLAIRNYNEISTLKQKADDKIKSIVADGELQNIIAAIDQIKTRPYLSGSQHTQRFAGSCRNSIIDELVSIAIGPIEDAINEELNEAKIKSLFIELEKLRSKKYISGSTRLQNFTEVETSKLIDRLAKINIKNINSRIENYLYSSIYYPDSTVLFLRKLNALNEAEYLKNNNSIQSYILEKKKKLERHEEISSEIKVNVTILDTITKCELLYPEYKGYISVCDSIRREMPAKRDTIYNN